MMMLSAKFHTCSWFMSQYNQTERNTLIYRRYYDEYLALTKIIVIKCAALGITSLRTRCQYHTTNNVITSNPSS
jgi:hypothetical protein